MNTTEATEEKTGEIMPRESDAAAEEKKKTLAVTRGWVTDDKILALRDQFKDITATTKQGYKQCVKAIGTVRGYRTKLEKSQKTLFVPKRKIKAPGPHVVPMWSAGHTNSVKIGGPPR